MVRGQTQPLPRPVDDLGGRFQDAVVDGAGAGTAAVVTGAGGSARTVMVPGFGTGRISAAATGMAIANAAATLMHAPRRAGVARLRAWSSTASMRPSSSRGRAIVTAIAGAYDPPSE